jgi:hypothetical protein
MYAVHKKKGVRGGLREREQGIGPNINHDICGLDREEK